jgi:hypothetical protein
MGWTIAFCVIFGTAALVPAVLSIVGVIRGNRRLWPAVLGTAFAVLLMVVTFAQIATSWGGCGSTSATSDSIACVDGRGAASDCHPDLWAHECHHSSHGFGPTCGKAASACAIGTAAGPLCPAGHTPVYPFCEPIQPNAAVKQPWATWSDLSFVASGLWLLWFLQFFVGPDFLGSPPGGSFAARLGYETPMAEIGWLSVVYGFIVIFMGPPSMWFHASIRDWGGWFDSMSVVFWLSFGAAYVLHGLVCGLWGKARGVSRTLIVLGIWLGLCLVLGVIGAICADLRTVGYFVSGGSWLILEIVYLIVGLVSSRVVYRRGWWLFAINAGLLLGTMILWAEFNPDLGRELGFISYADCQHREGFPGHAVFHILASFATITTFLSFASERKVAD